MAACRSQIERYSWDYIEGGLLLTEKAKVPFAVFVAGPVKNFHPHQSKRY